MKRLACLLFTATLALSGTWAHATEQMSTEKRTDIEKLLSLTQALKTGELMAKTFIQHMHQALRQKNPNVDAEKFDRVPEIVGSVFTDNMHQLLGLSTELYHRHFTHDDIKQLIAFYNSDIGKKMIKVTPNLIREGMTVGRSWGQSLQPEILKRLREAYKGEDVKI